MLKRPRVSIIMPTHNRAKMLKKAIKSVLAQRFKNFELIIINDGSTDSTKEVVKSFKDPRIVYLEKKNKGPASARNFGLLKTKGRYISYLDDDDIYYPQHLRVLSKYLDKHPRVGLVYGNALVKKRGKFYIYYPYDYSKASLEIDNIISYNSLMHRRSCLDKIGFIDKSLAVGSDWDLWLRISDSYKISHINKTLAQVMFHGLNLTTTTKNYYKWYMRIIEKRQLLREKLHKNNFVDRNYFREIGRRLVYKFGVSKRTSQVFIKKLVALE